MIAELAEGRHSYFLDEIGDLNQAQIAVNCFALQVEFG